MSPRCCLYTTQLYIRRIVYPIGLSRALRNPASELRIRCGPRSSDQPNCSYERLKVGKLHILRLFPPGHLLYLTKRCWLNFTPTQSLNYEFRSLDAQRYTQGSFIPLKLWLLILVLKTIKITPPPQQFNLFLIR